MTGEIFFFFFFFFENNIRSHSLKTKLLLVMKFQHSVNAKKINKKVDSCLQTLAVFEAETDSESI